MQAEWWREIESTYHLAPKLQLWFLGERRKKVVWKRETKSLRPRAKLLIQRNRDLCVPCAGGCFFTTQHLCIFPSSYGTFIYLHALDGERGFRSGSDAQPEAWSQASDLEPNYCLILKRLSQTHSHPAGWAADEVEVMLQESKTSL